MKALSLALAFCTGTVSAQVWAEAHWDFRQEAPIYRVSYAHKHGFGFVDTIGGATFSRNWVRRRVTRRLSLSLEVDFVFTHRPLPHHGVSTFPKAGIVWRLL